LLSVISLTRGLALFSLRSRRPYSRKTLVLLFFLQVSRYTVCVLKAPLQTKKSSANPSLFIRSTVLEERHRGRSLTHKRTYSRRNSLVLHFSFSLSLLLCKCKRYSALSKVAETQHSPPLRYIRKRACFSFPLSSSLSALVSSEIAGTVFELRRMQSSSRKLVKHH
jgi:hypothetical protein